MTVWALADLHLAFSVPEKTMEVFGPKWKDYPERIYKHWHEVVKDGDLVLIPGDISWALHLEEALIDLNWIHELPGEKLILKGNHDYWWSSYGKLVSALPSSIHALYNNVFNWNGFSFGGSRLWDTQEYDYDPIIDIVDIPGRKPYVPPNDEEIATSEKIFQRELQRLELSLKALDPNAHTRVALTHYPPIGIDLKSSRASQLLEKYKVSACVFGHVHNVNDHLKNLLGEARGVRYILTAADYLDFRPIKIF